MRKSSSLLLAFCLAAFTAFAQNEDAAKVQGAIEYLIENSEDDIDFTDLQIRLLDHLGSPINLNKAGFKQLQELEILNEAQILALLQHRIETGPLLSVYELQAVSGFNNELIEILKPFVAIDEKIDDEMVTVKKVLNSSKIEWFTRYRTILEDQRGFLINDTSANDGFLGSDYQLYSRINYRYKNNVSAGITAEKDIGEQFFAGANANGFDYYSAHFYLGDLGSLKSLAIGDYQMQAAQGLTMWSGLGFGKTADVMNVVKRGRNISPYRGANENQFLRGAAASYQLGKLELTGFYSQKQIDGNTFLDTLENDFNSGFTSFQTSGFHRTEAEIEDKDAVKETVMGGRAQTVFDNWNFGMTAVKTEFEVPLGRDGQAYQILDFRGDEITNIGFDYSGVLANVFLFGETSYSSLHGGFATVNGALFSFSHQLDGALIYRNYSPQYVSLYGNSFRESSRSQNERGIYLSLKFKPNEFWTIGGYFDQFTFPWLRFRNDLPSSGFEFLGDVNYRPSRSIELYARIKQQVRQANLTGGSLNSLTDELNRSVRFQFRYKVSSWQFTSRMQLSTYEFANSERHEGILMFQDVAFRPLEKSYYILARYALFNIDDFDARIYAYENDVLYSFSVPFYQKRGHRFYILTKLKLARRVDLWLRYARSTFINEDTIGSGFAEIQGNTQSEVKAQLRIKF